MKAREIGHSLNQQAKPRRALSALINFTPQPVSSWVEPKAYVMKSSGSLELAGRELRDMSWDPVRRILLGRAWTN